MAGVPLSDTGIAQAERLGRALSVRFNFAGIYSSPLERAHETAAALARHQGLDVQSCPDLSEIDYGAWTGKTFLELAGDPAWGHFNTARATAAIPDGEQPRAVQSRMVAAIGRLAASHQGTTIAIVSHADPVRFALLHYQSISLDDFQQLEIEPASVSAVSLSPAGAQILYVNDTTFAAP